MHAVFTSHLSKDGDSARLATNLLELERKAHKLSTDWLSARIATLKAALERHRHNIAKLEKRKAMYGPLDVPLSLLNELEEEQAMAMKVEAQLQHLVTGGEAPLDRLFREATRARINGQVSLAWQLYKQIHREDPTYPDIEWHVLSTEQELGRGYIDNGGRVIPARLISIASAIGALLCAVSSALFAYHILVPYTPTTTTVVQVPTHTPSLGTPGAPIVHVVQPGENLFQIALRYNTTVEAIAAANGIRNSQLIYVGQKLTIPRGGGATPLPAGMVYVPAGEFIMGSNEGDSDEQPVHTVYLDAFCIDRTEVTNVQYRACVKAGACDAPSDTTYYGNADYAQHPVVYVDWYQAEAYCEWAGACLPTEAEWEKAARGTDGRTYPWGEGTDCEHAQYSECDKETVPVGSKPKGASPYGALDMAGNVWEWVADWYGEDYYSQSPDRNPPGPDSGEERVVRGGSWYFTPSSVRCTDRGRFGPDARFIDIGFRCAWSSP